MTSPCQWCHLRRRRLDVYGLCTRCRYLLEIMHGHPSGESREGVDGSFRILHADLLPRGRDGRRGSSKGSPGRELLA